METRDPTRYERRGGNYLTKLRRTTALRLSRWSKIFPKLRSLRLRGPTQDDERHRASSSCTSTPEAGDLFTPDQPRAGSAALSSHFGSRELLATASHFRPAGRAQPPCASGLIGFISLSVALQASGPRRELEMSPLVVESDVRLVRPPDLELTILMPCLNEAETIAAASARRRRSSLGKGWQARS